MSVRHSPQEGSRVQKLKAPSSESCIHSLYRNVLQGGGSHWFWESTDFLIMYSTLSWSKERSSEAPRPAYGYSARKHLPFIVTRPWGSSRPAHVKPDTQVKLHLALHDLKCCLFSVAFSEGQFQTHANSCRSQITDFSLQNPKNQIPLSMLSHYPWQPVHNGLNLLPG